ncbi:MAG: hypothetical protein ISS17_00145 [Bacteroidales bacterium]|nr:hypothetical protein [Deltaproteobacteria bacterium]MBL7137168.1 hypothetical protein [Bacteroidales bacterium]
MNRHIFFFTVLLLLSSGIGLSQTTGETQGSSSSGSFSKPNLIRSGSYLKLGPVIPMGLFATDQIIIDRPPHDYDTTNFFTAKIGGNLGLGYLIYIGPGVADNYLRFGIDACFLDGWFVTSNPTLPATTTKKETDFWYYFVGQKFGPLITVNPVDRLMIDLSYKLNFNLSWHNSDFGYNIIGQEVMMNIRYRIILVAFQYNFGTMNYNDFDKSRPVHDIDISSFRVLLGFKF